MREEWFYEIAGDQAGPLTLEEIKNRLSDRELKCTVFVWKSGMANWAPVYSLPEFTSGTSTNYFQSEVGYFVEDVDLPTNGEAIHQEDENSEPGFEEQNQETKINQAKKEASGILLLLAAVHLALLAIQDYRTDNILYHLGFILVVSCTFIGLGIWARFQPMIPALLGLLIYVAGTVGKFYLDPDMAIQGLLIRTIVIVFLVRAVISSLQSRVKPATVDSNHNPQGHSVPRERNFNLIPQHQK